MVLKPGPRGSANPGQYSVEEGAWAALRSLRGALDSEIPPQFFQYAENVSFTTSPSGSPVYFPCPLKEQDATAAIMALVASATAAFADLRFGNLKQPRALEVDLDKTALFLMSAYVATIEGMDKANPAVKTKIPDTDLNQAQSVQYRRLSANLYETKLPGEFYHIHGSLEADKTLKMLGLPAFQPRDTGYRESIAIIEAAVKKFTSSQLEEKNNLRKQAGVQALQYEEFLSTPHGRAMKSVPPLTLKRLEGSIPAVPFPPQSRCGSRLETRQALAGIKVLELCRVIAGPTIGRSLAAHGASVMKVTSPKLPDVPFFQVDVNTGKHTTALHLRDNPQDRARFEALLEDADVLIDGYRPGALAGLGYGPEWLSSLAKRRDRGFVYVAEDCFGGSGIIGAEWSSRPGWQQIADCATGVAWAQGEFMGLQEPVVPPFPMSDYSTGALGCLAAMAGLYRRATIGGSWECRTSLCQYDMFLMSLGTLPPQEQARLQHEHDRSFFDLRHADSVDEVGKRALRSIKRLWPHLFRDDMMHAAWSKGFNAEVRWPREPIQVQGLKVGHVRPSRPNGCDPPTWDDWDKDEDIFVDGK